MLGNNSTLSGYFPEIYEQFEDLSGWDLGTIPNMATPYGRGIAEGRYPNLLFGDPPNKVNEDAAESLAVSLVTNSHSLIRALVQNQTDRWYLYNGGYNEPN